MEMSPFPDFESAAREVLRFLHSRLGFRLWMVTRTEGDDWIVLAAEDNGYGVTAGRVFRWADSFCSQMVQGLGPCIAPKSSLIQAYANAPIGRQVPIGAYIGVPLNDGDGQLFGTLCAIDPEPQNEALQQELELIQLLGRLLTSQLTLHLKVSAEQRGQQLHQLREFVDSETQALTREAWRRVLVAEERRCLRFGHPAYVIGIRVPAAAESARVRELVQQVRDLLDGSQTIARTESNELWILLPECNATMGEAKLDEVRSTLADVLPGTQVIGQVRHAGSSLEHAVAETRNLLAADALRLTLL